jgi:hypothetical protein
MIYLLVLELCSEIIWDINSNQLDSLNTRSSLHSCLIQGVPGSSKTLAANIFRSYFSLKSFENKIKYFKEMQ